MTDVLASFTTDALREEIYRRAIRERDKQPVQLKWCDECAHFKALRQHMSDVSPRRGEKVSDYQPCQKGHEMSFRMPLGPMDTEWGYFRRGCRDREIGASR